MRTFHPRLRSLAWLLTLASALTACGAAKTRSWAQAKARRWRPA